MRKLITILILILLFSQLSAGQSVPSELVDAIRKGDARKLSAFFHQNLEMTILDKDYMSSKIQATRILEDFFRNNKPVDFSISFEGTKEKSKYVIGTLNTKNKNFRINIFFLNKGEEMLIYYLSIEKELEYEL